MIAQQMPEFRVAVVGVGRVGLPLAVVCSKRHQTIGIDLDARAVERVNQRKGFSEPHVEEYLQRFHLRAYTQYDKLANSDFVFVCVGSQVPGTGYSSDNLLSTLKNILPHLNSRSQVLVLVTTIPPSSIRQQVLPFLNDQNINEKIAGVCYNPTMIALGDAVRGFENPDYLLIGESNPLAGSQLESFWKTIVPNNIRVFRSSILNVGMAKYALNTGLTLKITLMNALTELCEKVGGDIDILSDILRADPRIGGPKMFKGGLGYGGTCYPVDVDALRAECERVGLAPTLADAIQSINDHQVARSVSLIESFGKKKVAILGATYRPNTSVVTASQSIQIAERLANDGFEVMIYDPLGLEGAKAQLNKAASYSSDLDKALSFGGVLFFGVELDEFRKLGKDSFRKEQVVIDPWRMLRSVGLDCTYIGYGISK